MLIGNNTQAVNDNVDVVESGLEDRIGFNSFLKTMIVEKSVVEDSARVSGHIERDITPPNRILLKTFGCVLLVLCIFAAICGALVTTSPIIHILSLGVLTIAFAIIVTMSSRKPYSALHSLSLLAGIVSSFGLMAMMGESFAITSLNVSNDSFWVMAAIMSITVGVILKSRMALMVSITMTALWGYGYLSSSLNISLAVFAFPLIAISHILLASYLSDKIGKTASILMFWVWGGTVLSIAYSKGFLVFPMMISGLVLGFGAYYLAKAHVLNAWASGNQKPTRPWTWMFLMSSCLLAVLSWWNKDIFPVTGTETTLTQFVWRIGLIGGACLLVAISFLRRSGQSYSFPRRLISAIVILSIAGALHYQPETTTRFGKYLTADTKLMIYAATLGSIAILSVIKFISAIKNGSISWLIAATFILFGVFLASAQIEIVTLDLMGIALLSAMVSLCALAWTQTEINEASSTYRPLSERDKRRLHLSNPYGTINDGLSRQS
ncbi:MAG: hypothetical protein ABJ275_01550 [Maricaulaceae bacterium]